MFSLRAAFDASNEYYYITERNQKLKCLRVQLIYPNRKCFLKNYSAIFTANLSQTQNRINRICSFKANFFFFFNRGQKYFLCFHSPANTSPLFPPPQPLSMPAACGSPEICTDGISTLGVFTLKHIPGLVGRQISRYHHGQAVVCFNRTINMAKILKGTRSIRKGSHPIAPAY